jgi:hypothetical protein
LRLHGSGGGNGRKDGPAADVHHSRRYYVCFGY